MPEQAKYPRFILLLAAAVFFMVGVISATLSKEASYSGKDARKFERLMEAV